MNILCLQDVFPVVFVGILYTSQLITPRNYLYWFPCHPVEGGLMQLSAYRGSSAFRVLAWPVW